MRYIVGVMSATPKIKRPRRPVQRVADSAGRALPTAKELDLLRELGRRWGIDLPAGYRQDLRFVRAFLDVFAFDGQHNTREQILRRLRSARQLAWDGVAAEDIARKLDVPPCLGPVLRAYGIAQVPRSWRAKDDSEEHQSDQKGADDKAADEKLVDRLTQSTLAGDDSPWVEFSVSRGS